MPLRSRTTHPAVSQQTEQIIRARSIEFDFEPNVQISEIRDVEGNQVRLIKHRAPKEQVERYAVAMRHGALLPAIVLNERLERIDGNTRLEAHVRNGDATVPAYICHGLTSLEARSLSVELNQSNGLAMTDEEIRRFVDGAVRESHHADLRTLSRMTGVKDSRIARWVAETRFEIRAAQEQIEARHVHVLPASTRAALHAARLASVFGAVTRLAAEARMRVADVKRLVAQANAASSESDALTVIDAERKLRADEIRAVASGFSPRDNRRSSGSAQHLGGLARFGVDDLLDVSPERQHDTYRRMKLLRDLLDEAVNRAEQEWDLQPGTATAGDSANAL